MRFLLAMLMLLPALADARVEVEVRDPAGFRDFRLTLFPAADEARYLADILATHLRDAATRRLPPGTALAVVILDVDMAGEHRPSASHDAVRIVTELHSSRIELEFRYVAADGGVIASGRRALRELRPMAWRGRLDGPLAAEMALLDHWLAELASLRRD